MKSENTDILNYIKVASPCPANWDEMIGNEQMRFCNKCSRNVYNLSTMTREAASTLVNITEGRFCVMFYKRVDGTVMTDDCPRGLRVVKRKLMKVAGTALAVILSMVTWTTNTLAIQPSHQNARTKKHTKKILARRIKNYRSPFHTIGVIEPIYFELSPPMPTNPAIVPNPLPTDMESPPKPKIKD